ncbi:MAG: DivIVA domain-containing protein [Clostridiales bacterium]|nr:DivIVA domain-containing protein [Clostridiales bacterium]MDO4349535.1 DivIVA domain-containing protein [Eubacteriales bacterium]MDY4009219.1 DivIVA domain-containing protein [Candidatus Limiplasma sp.]
MALTIDDIYDKEFALKGGGYDRNDVDQFLDEICDEMTNMQEHIDRLEAELKQARADAEAAREAVKPAPQPVARAEAPVARTSETLESILLSAQRLADEAVENAKSKAEAIVKEAEEKAGQIVDDAQAEKTALSGELETLRKNAADYKDGLLALLNKHKSMLENDSFFKKQ